MGAITVCITKAKRRSYWYAQLIGESFEVYLCYDNATYILKEDRDRGDGPHHYIRREDCIEVVA